MKLSNKFFLLPQVIYKDDPYYQQESEQEIRQLIEENLFDVKMFEYTNDLTRGLGIIREGDDTALFGYFETLNDTNGAKDFFNKLESWATQNGVTKIIGPINFTTYLGYRIKLNHFDKKPFLGEPYNKDYYQKILEEAGYSIDQYYHSYRATDFPDEYYKYSKLIKENNSTGFSVEKLDVNVWGKYIKEFYSFIDQTFKLNKFYYPIPARVFDLYYGVRFGEMIDSNMSRVIFDNKGRVAAFTLMFKEGQGTMLIKTVGVHPKYQKNNLFNLLLADILGTFKENYNEVIACLVQQGGITDNYIKTFHTANKTNYACFSKQLNI